MGSACSMHGSDGSAHKILVGKHEGNRPIRRPRCRWEDNIRMNLREIEWEYVDWMHLAHVRNCVTISFSRRTLLHGVSQSVLLFCSTLVICCMDQNI